MKKIVNISLLILWMIFIFVMSSFDSTVSSGQSGTVLNFINAILNVGNIEILSVVIRKMAHLTEYTILGILVLNWLKDYSDNNRKTFWISIILCFIYACSDEFHQLFVSGRSGELRDVFIDLVGSFLGIVLYSGLNKLKKLYLLEKNK